MAPRTSRQPAGLNPPDPRSARRRSGRLLAAALMAIGLAGCKLTEQAAPSAAAGSGFVLDVATAADRLVAVGEHGRIVFSDDRGRQWQRASTPAREVLTAVAFADERRGWAVGHGGVILASVDGGASWQLQKVLDEHPVLLSVHFADERRGWAVGHGGVILASVDGGASWQLQKVLDEHPVLLSVHFADERRGWAVGHGPVVLHTTDGGATWAEQAITPDMPEPLFDVTFLDAETGVAVGAFGQIWRTEDGGQRWESVSLHAQDGGAFGEVMGGNGVSVADAHLYGVACFPQPGCAQLFAVGEGGVMLRSDDAGKSWRYVDSGSDVSFFGIVANAQHLLAFGMFGHAIVSEDGGETWSEIETDTERSLLAASWLPDGGAVLVGNDGVARHYPPGGGRSAPLGHADRDTLTAFVPLGTDGALLAGDMGFVHLPTSFAIAGRTPVSPRSN